MTVGFLSVHFVGKQALLHSNLFPVTVFHLYPVSQPLYLVFCIDWQKNGGVERLLTLPLPPSSSSLELKHSLI